MTIDAKRDSSKFVRKARGDSNSVVVTVTDSLGNKVDVSAYLGAALTVNSLYDPPDATTQLFTSAGDVATDGAQGTVTFPVTTGNTDVTPGTYYYDIQLTDATGKIETIVKSKFIIEQDITK